IEERTVARDAGTDAVLLAKTMAQIGLASSGSDARRLIAQGGVTVDGERAGDPNAKLSPGTYLLKVGKRKFARVTVQ
ncbi:MAG: S4 domain-containing protein, partial [Myxococcales bacterium]